MEEIFVASRIGILTVSDTRSLDTDESGLALDNAVRRLGFQQVERRICVDEISIIKSNLTDLSSGCSVVFTTGGTGFSRRDVTPEATADLIERQADSLSELIRLKGLDHTPFAHLSRGLAGIRGSCLIVNLPGSPKGAEQGFEAIAKLLPPILAALAGRECPVQT